MQIVCRACGANIPPEKLDLDRGVAQCAYCHAMFRIPGGPEAPAATRPEAPQPENLTIEEDGHAFRIIKRWFHPLIFGLLIFGIFWNGFMCVWFGIAIAAGIWFMALFGLLHAAVGVGIIYFVICSFVNRTIIEVNERELSVRHTPLPWPGNRTLPTMDIDQLYCRQTRHSGKHGVSYRYAVYARTRDGKAGKFITGLNDEATALFLEQRLEEVMGIADRPVAGAYEGRDRG